MGRDFVSTARQEPRPPQSEGTRGGQLEGEPSGEPPIVSVREVFLCGPLAAALLPDQRADPERRGLQGQLLATALTSEDG